MPKKRIAIIGLKGLPPFGGAANVGDNIIEQLANEYDFTVYSTASHTHHSGDYKGARQIVFRKFPVKKLNVFYYYLVSALHAVFIRRYDAIHLHQMDGAFILLLLRLRYKVVATSHGLTYRHAKWSKWSRPYFKLNEWFQARLSNHLTVVSKSLIPHYEKIIPATRISYIPNGVTPLAPAAVTLGASEYLLFAAGRIIPTKGLHILLSALHKCNYKGKLIVLGDHSQLRDYSRELFDLAAGLDVEFKGLIKEKPLLNAWIAGARLFVFPSTYEAMSMMLLEVAALSTPVVCSDIVENTDIFTADEMLFFTSGSDTNLAERLGWALAHPKEMQTFAGKAHQSLMDRHQWSTIARQYADIFDNLTTRSTRSHPPTNQPSPHSNTNQPNPHSPTNQPNPHSPTNQSHQI
ncbi:MAG TPA: glycosyltransferase family 4 protein [Puia sp.]|nr:glycosyltransferase family 4 protein [Puia sp.]